MKIAIIGLGYVGLPLGLRFAESGVSVLGLDVDSTKIAVDQRKCILTRRHEGTEKNMNKWTYSIPLLALQRQDLC